MNKSNSKEVKTIFEIGREDLVMLTDAALYSELLSIALRRRRRRRRRRKKTD